MTVSDVHTDRVAQLGDLVREERERQKLYQWQLADRVGVNKRTIRNWEHGTNIPVSQVPALERALGVQIVKDPRGGYRFAPGPPTLEGMDQVDLSDEGAALVIYVDPERVRRMSREALEEALSAARLAFLRAAREIEDQHPEGNR